MRQSLQLKIGQQLTMTPQLQQAIRLLQLSTLDLQQEIQEALDSNPLLEVEEDHGSSPEQVSDSNDGTTKQDANGEAEDMTFSEVKEMDTTEAVQQENMSDELPVDSSWDEYISAAPVASVSGASDNDDMVFQGETTDNIQDHILWQVRLTRFSPTDETIAMAIIEAIDDSGYLSVTTEDILNSLGDDDVELDEVEVVLKRIQLMDPLGVGARSLKECMLIQLGQFSNDTPYLSDAKTIVNEYIDLLGNRDYRTLQRKTKLKEHQLKEVMQLIHSLNPRPASAVITEQPQYVIPDVSVVKKKGRWIVELNPDSMPKVTINQQYAALSKTSKSSTDTQFIRSHLQDAKWFIKSLESRNDTLLKVANCIVQQQQAFFEYGDEAMKPMVLNDVAEMVDMHESTISRVTTQKYMHTPRGIFELKYFFSSHVSTENGGECSSTAIRALIKKLVSAENAAKPLSDSKIAEIMADQGIKVARRTIAKYRESLSIPPSNQRKSLL
ncbi:RNA polymerase factor sigma-54 [Flocculibacter collagenilyticus]|uniref:RNA polymerase factor sigma-54 n=1 Tax=Flocculibacter collagenilyticus TaxID=2744479 RepID=UPI0018F7CFED|nr:RNA polymerase factor sigma-54 [Flocculibacter collagenilyticus]